MTHNDLIARLDYLSERANPGPYGVESYGSGTTYLKLGTWVGHYASERVPMMGGGRAEVVNSNVPSAWGNTCRKGATAHLIAELVNAYRAGKLRVVDVDRRTSIEAADALTAAQERIDAMEGLLRDVIEMWDRCSEDPYDRGYGPVSDAVYNARAALAQEGGE